MDIIYMLISFAYMCMFSYIIKKENAKKYFADLWGFTDCTKLNSTNLNQILESQKYKSHQFQQNQQKLS